MNKIKNKNSVTFITFAYAKGVAHASVIPYLLLWIFQGFNLWLAFGIPMAYVAALAWFYTKSTKHDLSGASFFMTVGIILSVVMVIVILGSVASMQ
jgi:FtsH-binding integral membrane protein